MRLMQVSINGYKHLRDLSVSFVPPEEGNPLFRDGIPIRFLIGLNGSGKSAFLEGLCLIFSHLAQDELPGFDFFLQYEIWRGGRRHVVEVSNGSGDRPQIRVFKEGEERPLPLFSFAKHRNLLPDRVFVCASGNNNNFFDIAVRSPQDALHGELFDASLLGKSRNSLQEQRGEIDRALEALRRLEEDPICLFIDEHTAVLALAAFLAVLPGGEAAPCREQILAILDSLPRPVSFSLTLDLERLGALEDSLGGLFPSPDNPDGPDLSHWTTPRFYQNEDEGSSRGDQAVTFLFEPSGADGKPQVCVKSLTQAFASPIRLLAELIRARNLGVIKEAHLSFRLRGASDLLEENALSEGEYMLLVRLGLLAMGRQEESGQCLYLLDEPDVYLNERWNIDFVSIIHQIYQGAAFHHELLVATHSSLILTDAFPEQLYYFREEHGSVKCRNIRGSTFGGSRNEIMQVLFQTPHSVGSFSYAKIEELLQAAQSTEELEEQLKNVGSGYLRLRLLERLQRVKEG